MQRTVPVTTKPPNLMRRTELSVVTPKLWNCDFWKVSMKHRILFAPAILLISPAIVQAQEIFIPPVVVLAPDVSVHSWQFENEDKGSPDTREKRLRPERPVHNASLSYTPNKAQTRKNLASFVARTRATDPAGADKMAQLFASTDVVGQVDQMMRPMGLRADNVADAYTVWWITAWEAVNQRDMGSNADMVQAVKQQAASALLSTPQFASATNAQKQEMAEALLIQAALIDASEEVFANDSAQLRALSRAVNQGAMAMDRDLDLTKMTLTPNGFVPRSGGRSDAGDVSGDGSQLAATEEGGSNLALYAVAGTGLLAGVFALGKGLAKKG